MDKKVIIPKDVAEAIEHVRNAGYTNFTLINIETLRKSFPEQHEILNYYNGTEERLNNYLLALVNGYTVKQTPEDKVREYYDGQDRGSVPGHNRAVGIKTTLDLLGIKIEGINV